MGLILGTGNLTRFMVNDPIPEDYIEVLAQGIARYAFRALDESSLLERTAGWVNIMDMFDSEFAGMAYFKEPYVATSWRIDARKVPSKALKQHCLEEEKRIKTLEGVEYLPKSRRDEIREVVKGALLKRAIPVSRTYDMIWHLQKGTVIFGATGSKICDDFAEFFLRCFGLHLEAVCPYREASRILQKDGVDPLVLDGLGYSMTGEGH